MYEEDNNLVGTIVIGNSDNKLEQQHWAKFVEACISLISLNGQCLFFGGSPSFAPIQNAAWVIKFYSDFNKLEFCTMLGALAAQFNQEAIALVFGKTEFIRPCCALQTED